MNAPFHLAPRAYSTKVSWLLFLPSNLHHSRVGTPLTLRSNLEAELVDAMPMVSRRCYMVAGGVQEYTQTPQGADGSTQKRDLHITTQNIQRVGPAVLCAMHAAQESEFGTGAAVRHSHQAGAY